MIPLVDAVQWNFRLSFIMHRVCGRYKYSQWRLFCDFAHKYSLPCSFICCSLPFRWPGNWYDKTWQQKVKNYVNLLIIIYCKCNGPKSSFPIGAKLSFFGREISILLAYFCKLIAFYYSCKSRNSNRVDWAILRNWKMVSVITCDLKPNHCINLSFLLRSVTTFEQKRNTTRR